MKEDELPLYIKIDFRGDDNKLSAWVSRDDPYKISWSTLKSTISETRIRRVLIALANQIDPAGKKKP